MKGFSRRRFLQASGSLVAIPAATSFLFSGCSLQSGTLKIAHDALLTSWDPTTGLSSLDATAQSLYKAVFDSLITQYPDLSLSPGIMTDWGWNNDGSKIHLSLREDAFWHDGTPVTPDDVVWSLERAGSLTSDNPMRFIWSKITNFSISGNTVIANVKDYEPAIFKLMAYLTSYIMPKKAYTALGAEAWEKNPIGSGPYMLEKFEKNRFIRLKSFPQYWGPKPDFETVEIKMLPDAMDRLAELDSGDCDLAVNVPYEAFNRLSSSSKWEGQAYPITDVGMIFITNKEAAMKDKNIRLAMHHAIDKQRLIDELLLGFGMPIDSMQVPGYDAYDPSIEIDFDLDRARSYLSKSGFSKTNPVKLTIQTTRGYRPKDYEMIEMIVDMWREIGVEANIEVYNRAEHLKLRGQHKLAPAAFFNWSNSIGDPFSSAGMAMLSTSPDSTFKSLELDRLIVPLLDESDERKRILGYKEVDQYIADECLVIPLVQYVQAVVHTKNIRFTPNNGGLILPQNVRAL